MDELSDEEIQLEFSDHEGEIFEDFDQYNDSDTSADISDPNMEKHALYQDVDLLPVALEKSHFEEGLIYAMTLEENHEKTLLVMVIEVQE